jgi:tetratricopeptide (TPR) repeat protein
MPGIVVRCHRSRRPAPIQRAIEVDIGSPPYAFTGIRRVLLALGSEAGGAIAQAAARHPAEWAELFPGDPAASSAPALRELAGAPSPRALDGDSEHAFRVIQAAADALVAAVADLARPLVLRNCGSGDLVSLRGVMRAVERSRAVGVGGLLVCAEWDAPCDERRRLHLDRLRVRLDADLDGEAGGPPASSGEDLPESAELHHLQAVADTGRPAAERVAAALLAVRACFLSTNHEGVLVACRTALGLVGASGDDVPAALAAMDDGRVTPDAGIATEDIAGRANLEAALWRSAGIAHSFLGEGAAAVEAFRRALAAGPSPLAAAVARECLGRQLGRDGEADGTAAAELRAGLALVEADPGAEAAITEGWLRDALALDAVRRRRLREASEELVRALRRVADRHDPAATELKLNLIGGISRIHETARRHPDALRMWHRYLEASADWGDRFVEHYAYREGGLHLAAGDEGGLLCHRHALRRAAALGDAFHGAAIAAEVGAHHLAAGRDAEALTWFSEAVELGRRTGDPHRLGQAMAGEALAAGEADPRAAAAMLRLATTGADAARALAGAVEAGDRDAVLAGLPRPRTTLRRRFDLVSL